jgi:hypothetical protein
MGQELLLQFTCDETDCHETQLALEGASSPAGWIAITTSTQQPGYYCSWGCVQRAAQGHLETDHPEQEHALSRWDLIAGHDPNEAHRETPTAPPRPPGART